MIEPLNDRASFARLAGGHRARCGAVRLRYADASMPSAPDSAIAAGCPGHGRGPRVRVAYAIGRKSGNAVTRNRIRRRLRAALFELNRDQPEAFAAGDYLFTAGAELSTLPFGDVQRMVHRAVVSVADAVRSPSSRDS